MSKRQRGSVAGLVDRFLSSRGGDVSRTSSPSFSLLGHFARQVEASLAGDELDGSRFSQMSSMRQSKIVERRHPLHVFRRGAAVLVPKLRVSVFSLGNRSLRNSTFFFSATFLAEVFEEATF